MHTHTHTHTHTCTHANTRTHALTHTHTHTHTHTYTHTHTHSLSLTHTHTHTHKQDASRKVRPPRTHARWPDADTRDRLTQLALLPSLLPSSLLFLLAVTVPSRRLFLPNMFSVSLPCVSHLASSSSLLHDLSLFSRLLSRRPLGAQGCGDLAEGTLASGRRDPRGSRETERERKTRQEGERKIEEGSRRKGKGGEIDTCTDR